jgi:hypothetical protein
MLYERACNAKRAEDAAMGAVAAELDKPRYEAADVTVTLAGGDNAGR